MHKTAAHRHLVYNEYQRKSGVHLEKTEKKNKDRKENPIMLTKRSADYWEHLSTVLAAVFYWQKLQYLLLEPVSAASSFDTTYVQETRRNKVWRPIKRKREERRERERRVVSCHDGVKLNIRVCCVLSTSARKQFSW